MDFNEKCEMILGGSMDASAEVDISSELVQACAEVCKRLAEQEDEGELSTALVNASIAIMNRTRHAN